jgi:CheY-like chemotaxis protein
MKGRKKPRALIQKNLTINGTIKATAFDVSEDGMYIHTDRHFAAKDIIDIALDIDGEKMTLKAAVRHVHPGFGIGVRFMEMSPEKHAVVKRFLCSPSALAAKKTLKVVLLIDSNAMSRTLYKNRLLQDGFCVIESANGQEALRILQLSKPDILVLDIQTEGISAFKILQFMHTKKELEDIPVIVLSARFLPGDVDMAVSLGVRDYLVKATTSPNTLSEKVSKTLAG